MQVVSYDGNEERVAIASICLNDEVLAKSVSLLSGNPFASKHANIVAGWCRKHFEQYSRAPGVAGLTAIHSEWTGSTGARADGEAIAKLLESLPNELSISVEYSVDLIARCVLKANLKRTADNILGALSQGKIEQAAQLVESFQRPEARENGADGVFLLEQVDDIDEVLSETNAGSLIKFPERLKAMGEFFGPSLCRDAFVSFVAPEKGGKSTHLAALCHMAVIQGLRVAYFNLGDLSERQYRKRMYTPFVRRPAFPSTYRIPKSLKYTDKEAKVEFIQRYEDSGYTGDDVRAALEKHQGADTKRFRLKTSPAAGVSSGRQGKEGLYRYLLEGNASHVHGISRTGSYGNTIQQRRVLGMDIGDGELQRRQGEKCSRNRDGRPEYDPNGTPITDLPDELGSSPRSGLLDAISGASNWREWLYSSRTSPYRSYMDIKPHWFAEYLHQIQPFVQVVMDIENRATPKYLVTNDSLELIGDGLKPEDREMVRAVKQHIETIRKRFEDKFYYEARRSNQTTGQSYPGTTGWHSPVDPGNGP